MGISISTRQVYSEIDEFLGLLNDEQRNMIPQKLRELFSKEKDRAYTKKINPAIPIKNQNLKKETLGLIALLNLQYWCQDEKEKERLKEVYAKNDIEYQEKQKMQFDSKDIFKKDEAKIEVQKEQPQCLQMVENKDSLLKRIMNRLSKFLKTE